MKIGFIGAGRAGCSIGKYLADAGKTLTGYYDKSEENAKSAAEFTGSKCFDSLKDLSAKSSLIFLTTPDGIIPAVWEELRQYPLDGRIICHCSGALPSNAFTGIEETKAYGCSLHPMLPFSSRFASYEQLHHAFFTAEGQKEAVKTVTELFTGLGNTVCQIQGEHKPKYHAAASILSNQVAAVLDTGYRLLEECGFTREEAVSASAELIRRNIENIFRCGCIQALTGPIERNDIGTVQKHLACLKAEDKKMYQILGIKLISLAEQKNPESDYRSLLELLQRSCS